MPLQLPSNTEEIARIQSQRKKVALAQARLSPFYQGRLDEIDSTRLDDPAHWAQIPILTKDDLRELSDSSFYQDFCLTPSDGIAEYWRSGGSTGKPLFYPRSYEDIRYALLSFARIFECVGIASGECLHNSFPLGIHPVGHLSSRAGQMRGVGTIWAGAGTTTPSRIQIELVQRLKPTVWMGMSSYGLHLSNLAESIGVDLSDSAVKTIICSAEPLSDAKRDKLSRTWGATVRDSFGMTEAGLIGAEDDQLEGFRAWSDMYFMEVVDPETHEAVADGVVGALVVTPLWTNHCTPFLRWMTGDMVTIRAGTGESGPYSIFPLLKHAHRTSGFFKIRGININHAEFEDFIFRDEQINDFKCELVNTGANDVFRLSIELARNVDGAGTVNALGTRIKDTFEVSPEIAVLPAGTLAQEFESSVKAPRFSDNR